MAKTKISELPVYTGDTTGVFLVMDSADLSTTYRVAKEDLTGISGSSGTSGTSGQDGQNGSSGTSGISGTSGTSGIDGTSGTSGESGSSGTSGTSVSVSGTSHTLTYFDTTSSVASLTDFHVVNNNQTIAMGTTAFNSAQPERLMVDSYDSFNIATFQTSATNSFAEVNIKNFGGGANASTDLVIWNDSTTEESGYFDIGMNSSDFAAADGTYAGDAYIVTSVSDLYIAANATDTHGHVHIIGGGNWDVPQISIFNDRTIGFNTRANPTDFTIPTSGSGFVYEFSGSVKLDNDLTVDGDITTNGQLFINGASGLGGSIEGGQINLAVGSQGTTLTSSINIDVYGDRLRIFEGGGTNRGGYFDITQLDPSAGTNLLTAGSSGTSGTSGIDGTSGTSGTDGTSGSSGTSGLSNFGGAIGSFSSTLTQTTTGSTVELMTFNSIDLSDNITSGSTLSEIKVLQSGRYNLQFSAQIQKIYGGSPENIFIWFKKNGIDIPNSNTDITLANNNSFTVASWNILVELNANDTVSIAWYTTDQHIELVAVPNPSSGPSIPSVIITLTQI